MSCLPKYYLCKHKSKNEKRKYRAPLHFVFSEPSAFRTAQTRRTIEKTNIVSKFEAVYCTMLTIWHTQTPTQRRMPHSRTHTMQSMHSNGIHLQRHGDDSKSNRMDALANTDTHVQFALKPEPKLTLQEKKRRRRLTAIGFVVANDLYCNRDVDSTAKYAPERYE